MKKKTWYKLDNAAKIFPPISNEKRGSMFSVSVLLKESIDGKILNDAVNIILERFPTFKVRLKRGVFWYYLEENNKPFIVEEEPDDFLSYINESKTNNYLFRVFYFNNKITLSIFHALTDANGGMEFLKALIYEYLVLKGYKIKSDGQLTTIYSPPTFDEKDDQFLKIYDKNAQKPNKENFAFRVSGTPLNRIGCCVTTGTVSVTELKKLAKQYNVTITAYLAGLLMYSIYTAFIKDKRVKNKLIKIVIPVNLRKFYSTKTMRNFILYTRPEHNFVSPISLEECIKTCSKQLIEGSKKESLDKILYSNVKIEKNWLLKIVPLFIKDIALNIGWAVKGDSLHTATLSNIGKVELPEEFNSFVDSFIFTIGASYSAKIMTSVVSYKDKLNISFCRSIVENGHEKIFFNTLADNGIKIQINSNYWEENKWNIVINVK